MTSSQILISGLAVGGFVLLGFLLIFFLSISRLLWRKQAIAAGQNRIADSPLPLLARFSDLSPSSALEQPTGPDVGEAGRPTRTLNWKWLLILLPAIIIDIYAEFSLIALLNEDANANIQAPMLGFLVAGALFVFVCRKVETPSLPAPFKAILPERQVPPVALWITNLGLSIVLLNSISLDSDLPNWTNYLLLGAWFVNILLFCWNVFQIAHVSLPNRDAVREWWRAHRLDVLLLVLIGLAAFLIRVIGLEKYPYAFINDEGEVGWVGLRILWGQVSTFFITDWAGQASLSFLPVALSIKLLGNTAFAVRLFSAFQGTLAIIFLYLFAREAFDRPTAFFAACLLAALPWHVHFSRLGVMNVSDSLFSAGALWLTYRALRRGNYIDYLPAGLMTGLSLYTYVGSRLVVAMAIGVLGYAALRQRDYLRTHFRHLAIFVLAFLIVASPMIFSFSRHFDEFMGRINQESILNNLEQTASDAGMQPLDFVVRQIQLSSTVFIATPALGNFFDAPRPYLAWWAAVFLILGMAYTLWHFKQVRCMLLLGWFWAPVLLGSGLTYDAPSHQRMLGAAPALALLVALGLWTFAQSMRLIFTRLPVRWLLAVCVLVVAFTAWQDINFYFVGEFRTGHYFEVEGNEFSYEVGMRAQALGPDYRLLLIGEPDIFASFADFHYLAPDSDTQDFNTVDEETIANLRRNRGIFFATIPSRIDELKMVRRQLPGGTWLAVPRTTQQGMSYYAYILPGLPATP